MVVILILSFLVILHELGHFLAALWLKIKVDEFGLGFPPKAKTLFKWRDTEFTLNWIPFGGFVRLLGEMSGESDSKSAFSERPVWQRLVVLLAGPAVNLIIALIFFGVVYSIGGIPISLNGEARISQIAPNSPAASAEVPTDYRLVGFLPVADLTQPSELHKTPQISDVQQFIEGHRGQTWRVVLEGPCQLATCESNTVEKSLYLRTLEETPANQGAMGVMFREYELQFYPWYEMPFRGMIFGMQQTVDMTMLMLSELGSIFGKLFTGQGVSQSVAGPIGIVHQASEAGVTSGGWLVLLNFAGMISLNLAVMNVLPIPALDGGRALLVLAELIAGKRRMNLIEGYVNYAGFILLCSLLVLISLRDIWQLWLSRG
jgi:regulator of sigma E protease